VFQSCDTAIVSQEKSFGINSVIEGFWASVFRDISHYHQCHGGVDILIAFFVCGPRLEMGFGQNHHNVGSDWCESSTTLVRRGVR